MRRFIIAMLFLAVSCLTIQQVWACAGGAGEKKAIFKCLTGCTYDTVTPTWDCTSPSGSYKVYVGVTAAGSGGTYVVQVYDVTTSTQLLSTSFTATGVCSTGDFNVDLVNGHKYELSVDALSPAGCTVGDHAWAKMCYNCYGS